MVKSHVAAHGLFHRHAGNPILDPSRWPYPAAGTFNPGAARVGDRTVLLVRVEDLAGYSHLTPAWSDDGLTDWQVDAHPCLLPSEQHEEERWGLEDPRIVWLEEERKFAVTYVSYSPSGPLVSLATTLDFRAFERFGPLVPPEDKDAALLPRRIQGLYGLIHRPIMHSGEAHVWISFSPDLQFWGKHRLLLPSRPGSWDELRVGLGAPPIETPDGWLLIYHGVRLTTAGAIYRVGLALLDLEEPWRLRSRSPEWVFAPQEPYELGGNVPGIVFPSGAIWNRATDELLVYYGAGDRSIAVATARMADLLTYLREHK